MISFALPWALVGLVAAALPLLLHLVQRHRAPDMVFPALRYLEDATRRQQRRLQFRHWLLLLIRTLLIIAIVLAAAGMTMRRGGIGPHAAAALVVVVDNSAASSVVVDGQPLLVSLLRAAQGVLDRATANDRLWVIAADGVARTGPPALLRAYVASLHTVPTRFDLGAAVSRARELIRSAGKEGGVAVVSAMPREELTTASGTGTVLVLRPTSSVPANRGITSLRPSLQPWGPAGGQVTIEVASDDTTPVPVSLSVGSRAIRNVLVTPGVPSVQRIAAQVPGWSEITATLPPDEFRLDDASAVAVQTAPPPRVQWDVTDRFVNAAMQVLAADGRIQPGTVVHLGELASGPSVVLPPVDAARVGGVNRALQVRGVPWRFGLLVAAAETTDSGSFIGSRESVTRRFTLEATGHSGDVLATVSGAPWLVRSGDVLLVGSRLQPDWTGLPLSAAFVPFIDAVLTTAAQRGVTIRDVVAGQSIMLPPTATGVTMLGVTTPVDAAHPWVAPTIGIYHLLAGIDTIGAVRAQLDPRVSQLSRATDAAIGALWTGTTIASLEQGPRLAFAFGTTRDLRPALLWLALICVLAEAVALRGGMRMAAR